MNAPLRTCLILATMSLGGCAQYLDRSETVSFVAGDAVHTNTVTHMIDPWPVHARNTAVPLHGDRAQRVIERYRTGAAGGAAAAPTSR